MSIGDLWSPRTDDGVALQVVITVLSVGALAWVVRRERALLLLVVGVGMVVLAWYGVRALH